MHDLQRFLIDYDTALLRALAQNRGVALTTNRQRQAAEELAAALLDPLSVRVALARLSEGGRAALDSLLAGGGQMRAPHFFRQFGSIRPIGPGRLERETPWQAPANPAEELHYLGFLFRAFAQPEGGPGEFVFLPTDLIPQLPEPQVGPPVFALELVPAPARQVDGGEALVEDLFTYLVFVQIHDLRPYADGRLGRRDTAALRERLTDADERRLALLRHLAERLGFVARPEGLLRLGAGPVKGWLSAPASRRLAALQEAWRDDPTWNDLCQVPGLVCDREAGWHLRYDPVATRRAVLAQLARCPLEGWWTRASFVAAVKLAHPDFQRPDGDYTSWYIRDAESGEYLSGFEAWDQVEGALLADLLAGPLHWLGIVARAPGDLCGLTAAGARLLGLLAEEPEAPPAPPLVVHPDFGVELPPPVNFYARFQAARFAEFQSAAPCRYRLTAGALGRALSRGLQVEQILAFLRQASDDRVPANVAGQMQLWAGRFGQVHLEEMALLTAKNERIMKELSVLPETRDLIARVLSPTSALVRKRDLPRLHKTLRDLGFLLPEDPQGNPQEHD